MALITRSLCEPNNAPCHRHKSSSPARALSCWVTLYALVLSPLLLAVSTTTTTAAFLSPVVAKAHYTADDSSRQGLGGGKNRLRSSGNDGLNSLDHYHEKMWGHALIFTRGMSHEVEDVFDEVGGKVSVSHTFCHGNHCAYYRQPLEFMCGHKDHFDLLALTTSTSSRRRTGLTLGEIVSSRAAADAEGTQIKDTAASTTMGRSHSYPAANTDSVHADINTKDDRREHVRQRLRLGEGRISSSSSARSSTDKAKSDFLSPSSSSSRRQSRYRHDTSWVESIPISAREVESYFNLSCASSSILSAPLMPVVGSAGSETPTNQMSHCQQQQEPEDAFFARELRATIKSFLNQRRYFPLTPEEAFEALRPDLDGRQGDEEEYREEERGRSTQDSTTSEDDAEERARHKKGLMGEFDSWQPAVMSRFEPSTCASDYNDADLNEEEEDHRGVLLLANGSSELSHTRHHHSSRLRKSSGGGGKGSGDDGGKASLPHNRVGHPLHKLRLVAHSSGGTYSVAGNKRIPALLERRMRRGRGEADGIGFGGLHERSSSDYFTSSDQLFSSTQSDVKTGKKASLFPLPMQHAAPLPDDLDISVDEWACAPRRSSLHDPSIGVENIHIICIPSEDTAVLRTPDGDDEDNNDGRKSALLWERAWRATAGDVWGSGVRANGAHQRGTAVYGERFANRERDEDAGIGRRSSLRNPTRYYTNNNNYTTTYHCALHYHLVNYGEPNAKAGVVVLGIATIAFVVVMMFFVGGRWYQEQVGSHKTKAALKRLDEEAADRAARRRKEEEDRARLGAGREGGPREGLRIKENRSSSPRGGLRSDEDHLDDDTIAELPLDVSAVNAFGQPNSKRVVDSSIDPAIARALREAEMKSSKLRGADGAVHAFDGHGAGEVGLRHRGRKAAVRPHRGDMHVATYDSYMYCHTDDDEEVRNGEDDDRHHQMRMLRMMTGLDIGGSFDCFEVGGGLRNDLRHIPEGHGAFTATTGGRGKVNMSSSLSPGGVGSSGGLYNNPRNLTLGDLLNLANDNKPFATSNAPPSCSSSPSWSRSGAGADGLGGGDRGRRGSSLEDTFSYVPMPWDTGVTPRKIPSSNSGQIVAPEVVQTVEIDEY